ncbi:uncharacterized protein LOC117507894 [Thalassophryne amazonica]|uniref:uncharacterized protein LOC117507894 n=1 Tax=Thalassophryne amazonica TaxID=390379 RepID=UPI001471079E|nr:uncharacterized protein LOC117507894 [Thalassophryne amazonica]
MNSLCIGVVLSLLTASHSAPLTCEPLLKAVEKGPDLSGKWYVIAHSSDICLIPLLVNTLLWTSFSMDFTEKTPPNTYTVVTAIKMFGYCVNDSDTIFYKTNTIFDVNSKNVTGEEPHVLLQSGCPDCIVIKDQDTPKNLLLLSRRKTVSTAEVKEFETQAQCLGWSKPQVFNNDDGFDNCKWLEDDDVDVDFEGIYVKMTQRLKKASKEIKKCVWDFFLTYLPSLIDDDYLSFIKNAFM